MKEKLITAGLLLLVSRSLLAQPPTTLVALKTKESLSTPVDGMVTIGLASGNSVKIRATDIDYDRTSAYTNVVVIKPESAITMTDKASGRKYLNLTFSRRFVATAWLEDIDYDVVSARFPAYRPPPPAGSSQKESSESGTATRTLPSVTYVSPDGKRKVTVEARVTESNATWSRFSWKATVENTGSVAASVSVTIEFQDSDGFPLDDSSPERVTVAPGSEKTMTGFELIRADVAPRVAKVAGKVGPVK
jgi:non-canonical (house-cleaning) NTP pyrophosphatase